MTIQVDGLGSILDLATALGIVDAGAFNNAWFANPGTYVNRMLRNAVQRDALMRALDNVFMRDDDATTDAKGRKWVGVARAEGVSFYLVVHALSGGGSEIGMGVRLSTRAQPPVSSVAVYVPLFVVPLSETEDARVALGTRDGRVELEAQVTFGGHELLHGLGIRLDAPTHAPLAAGEAPAAVVIALHGLRLPGQATPRDVILGESGLTDLGDDVIRLAAGLLQDAVRTPSAEIGELLALVGLSSDAALPPLPIERLFAEGPGALEGWVAAILASESALSAWLGHAAALVARGAVVTPAARPSDAHVVSWSLLTGAQAGVTLRAGSAAGGATLFEVGGFLRWDGSSLVPGSGIELDVMAFRATLGATPSLLGLPRLGLHARVGPRSGSATAFLLPPTAAAGPLPSMSARACRTGLALGEDRQVAFVLALDEVTIGSRSYPSLDLTNPSTLADVATNAVDSVLDGALASLGTTAGGLVRVLLGLQAPATATSWPIEPVHVIDLLSRPLESVLAYHARVLTAFPAGYADILGAIGSLFLSVPRVANGSGTVDRPWRIDVATATGGSPRVAVLAWQAAGSLRFALAADATVVDLGGSCPRITARLQADLAYVDLEHRTAEPFPWFGGRLEFGGRAGEPLRIGPNDAAMVADRLGLELALVRGRFAAQLVAPGLGLEIGGEVAPLALPAVDDAGAFVGTVPYRAIELICGAVLRFLDNAWALEIGTALGWMPGRATRLSIEELTTDPLRAIEEWLLETEAHTKASWLSFIIGGAAAPGLAAGLRAGRGDEDSPYLLPLGGGTRWPTSRHGYVFLQTPKGPEKTLDDFRPEALLSLLSSAGARTNDEIAERIATALYDAASVHDEIEDLLDGRGDIAGGLSLLLARWADSDGQTPAVAATYAGATAVRWEDTTARELWRRYDRGRALGLAADASTIFVTLDPDAWTDVGADRRIDLTAAGRAPETFDTTAASALDGPWAVELPRRRAAVSTASDDPTERQGARLARVVDAVFARSGQAVTLVAEGAAGHAARFVAATHPRVRRLVTLGTPHAGADYSVLDTAPAAGALRLLSSLVPRADVARAELPEVVLGRGLLDALDYVYDARHVDIDDLVPPAAPRAVPSTVEQICIAGATSPARARQALVGLALRGLQDAFERAEADEEAERVERADSPVPIESEDELSLGLGVRAEEGTDVIVTTDARLRLWAVGDTDLSPVVVLRIGLRRAGGYLVGGPLPGRAAGTPRAPSVRRATVEVEVPLRDLGDARVAIVLHDADALTAKATRWKVQRSGADGGLDADTRILLGRAFGALGPIPASGAVRSLVDALAAAALVAGTPAVGGPVGLNVEALERLLLDPVAFFRVLVRDRGAADAARALAAFAGGTSTPSGGVTLSFDGVTVAVDVTTMAVDITVTDLPLAGGVDIVRSELHLPLRGDATGRLGIALGGAGPGGRPVLEITSDPLTVRVAWDGSAREAIALYPTASEAGLARLVRDVVPEQLLWAGVTFVRALDPRVAPVLDPLLHIFGLLTPLPDGRTRVVVPTGLLSAPGEWFLHGATLGATDGRVDPTKLRDLFDAAGNLLSIRPSGTPSGTWALPFGVTVSARGDATTRTGIDVAIVQALGGAPLRIGGGFGVLFPDAARPLGANLEIDLGVGSGATAATLIASAGTDGATIALDLGAGRRIAIYPAGPGITDLGAAVAGALTYALPIALDAVAGLSSPPAAAAFAGSLRTLGDALGLRVASHFNADQIAQLAAHPATELPQRIVANLAPGLTALAGLLGHAMPAGWVVASSGTALTIARTGSFDVSFTPSPGAMRLAVSVLPVTVFGSARIEGALAISEAGLGRLRVGFSVDPASPLVAGPLRLAPVAEVELGSEVASSVSFGFALDTTKRLLGVVRFQPTVSFAIEGRGAALEEAAVLFLVPLVANLALSIGEVRTLLARHVFPTKTLAELLDRVALTGPAHDRFDPGILVPAELWTRLLRLAANVAGAAGDLVITPLTLGVATRTETGGTLYGISLSIADGQRLVLVDGDVWVGLEIDATWIVGSGAPGLAVYLLRVDGTTPSAVFDLAVRGLGVRIGRREGPLLDVGVSIDTLALHGLIEFDTTHMISGGGQIELGGFRIPVGGASGGDGVASGLVRDASNGTERPVALFSPGFSVQSSALGPRYDLRAGPGNGPWWLPIQRGFGPVYIEQIGFGVRKAGDRIDQISLLLDARASLLGVTVAVDDLAIGISTTQPLDNPSSWNVSLAGLSVALETSSVQIAGGLRRHEPDTDYIGMLTVRFSVYGITAYGGYAVTRINVTDTYAGDPFTSFFLFGALSATIGGPPCFFITGIGAGIGINRRLVLPTGFDDFAAYPLIRALDRSAIISSGPPRDALDDLSRAFPPKRGAFWMAAGVSFTSFVFIEGVIVLAVEIDDGLVISVLGLAHTSLPRPEATLVQIELGLIARFSTKEGVLWIQGQLTDNSWFLVHDCRLTGGFAFVMWFKGDHKGEFVTTIGGYHPSFSREGYPIVPRLGLTWSVSDVLVIKGEAYFALTSEAIMAGLRIEARLTAGPLWAYLRVGGDAIVYFDPFWFSVTAFAEIGAGITIDIDLGWFGHIRITIDLHLSASILMEGPDFRGRAAIDLGVCSAEIAFGSWNGAEPPRIAWPAFKQKYLEQTDDDLGVLGLSVGKGAQPASPSGTGKPPTGTAADPYLVLPEFRLELRSKGAVGRLTYGSVADGTDRVVDIVALAIAPMGAAGVMSTLNIVVRALSDGTDRSPHLAPQPTRDSFPKGVWVADDDRAPIPKGEVIEAGNGATLISAPTFGDETPEIDYHQVDVGPRHPLPFVAQASDRARVRDFGLAASTFAALQPLRFNEAMGLAAAWLASGGASPTRLALERRRAPPRLAPLALGVGAESAPFMFAPAVFEAPVPRVLPHAGQPALEARLAFAPDRLSEQARTSVGAGARRGAATVAAPSLSVARERVAALGASRLVRTSPAAVAKGHTIHGSVLPFSGRAGGGAETRVASGQSRKASRGAASLHEGASLPSSELHIYRMPNAARERDPHRPIVEVEGASRLVVLAPMGAVLHDDVAAKHRVALPVGTERLVVLPGGDARSELAGFTAATRLAQIGRKTLLGPGCVIDSSALRVRRFAVTEVRASWVRASEAMRGPTQLTTRFTKAPRSLAIVLEQADGAASADDLDLTIRGGKLGPSAMTLVSGASVVVLYAITPDEDGRSSVHVTLAKTERIHLGGVLGFARSVDELAILVRTHDVHDLLGPLARPGKPAHVRFVARGLTNA